MVIMTTFKNFLPVLLYAGCLCKCSMPRRFDNNHSIKRLDTFQDKILTTIRSKTLDKLAEAVNFSDFSDVRQLLTGENEHADSYESSKLFSPPGSLTGKNNEPSKLFSQSVGLSGESKVTEMSPKAIIHSKNERLSSYLRAIDLPQYDPEKLYKQVKHLHDTLQNHPLYYSLLSHDTLQMLVEEVSVLSNDIKNLVNNTYTETLDAQIPPEAIEETLIMHGTSSPAPVVPQARPRPSFYYANDPPVSPGSSSLQTDKVNEVSSNTNSSSPTLSSNLFSAIHTLHNQISMAEPLVHKAGAILQEMLTEKNVNADTAINLLPALLPMVHEGDASSSSPSTSLLTPPQPPPSSSLTLSPLSSSSGQSHNSSVSNTEKQTHQPISTSAVDFISSSNKSVHSSSSAITSTLQMTELLLLNKSESLQHSTLMQSSTSTIPPASAFHSNAIALETVIHNTTSTVTVTHYLTTTTSKYTSSLSNNYPITSINMAVPTSSATSYSSPVTSSETFDNLHPGNLTANFANLYHDADLTGNFISQMLTSWTASSGYVGEDTEDSPHSNSSLQSSYISTHEQQSTTENTSTVPDLLETTNENVSTLLSNISPTSAKNISLPNDHVSQDHPVKYSETPQVTPTIHLSSSIRRDPSNNKDNPETAGPAPDTSTNSDNRARISADNAKDGERVEKKEELLLLPELQALLHDSTTVFNDNRGFTPHSHESLYRRPRFTVSATSTTELTTLLPQSEDSITKPATLTSKLITHQRTSPPQIFDRLSLLFAKGSTTQPPITTTTLKEDLSAEQLHNALLLLSHLQDIFNNQQQANVQRPLSASPSLFQQPSQPGIQVSVIHNTPNHNSDFDVSVPGQPFGPPLPVASQPNAEFQGYRPGYHPSYGTNQGYPRNPPVANQFFNNPYPQYPYPYPYHIPQFLCQGGGASTSTSTGPGSASAAAAAGGGCGGGSTSTSTSVGQSAGAAPGTVSVGTNTQGSDRVTLSTSPGSGQAPVVRPPAIPERDVSNADSPSTTRSPPFSIRFGSRSTTTTPAPSVENDNYVRVLTALNTLMQYLNATRQQQQPQQQQQQQQQQQIQVTTMAPNSFSVSVDLYVPILSELLRRTTTTTTTLSPPLAIPKPLPVRRPQLSTSHVGDQSQSIQELLKNGYTAG